jgi:hypothetical protein
MDPVFTLTQTIKSLLILAVVNGTGIIHYVLNAQSLGSSTIKECAFLFPTNAKLPTQMVHAYLAGKDTT